MNVSLTGQDVYRLEMIKKLVHWDWLKPCWNQYSSFFDDAITILSEDSELVLKYNERQKKFESKYGLTLPQAEIKIFLRITGVSTKKLVREDVRKFPSYKKRSFTRASSDREINWLEMAEDLRRIRIWVQNQVKEVASGMGLNIS